MALVSIPWHPSHKDLRIFAGLQFVFIAIISAPWIWRHGLQPATAALGVVSAVVAIVGLASPQSIRPVYLGWMIAVFPIGWLVSHVILAAAYFLVFTPIGWLLRLSGRDPLERQPDAEARSYWKDRPPSPEPARYFRQF